MLMRWIIGLGVIAMFYGQPHSLLIMVWVLWWMVPPALSASITSMLWGGNLYPSALLSRNLSILLPIALSGLLLLFDLGFNAASLNFFYVILVFGLALPAILSQLWRKSSPVTSKRHSKEWKFIGVWSVVIMATITGYQFCPATLLEDVFFSSTAAHSVACLRQLGIAISVFLLMRLIASLSARLSARYVSAAEARDIYILFCNPNFYLWASLVSSGAYLGSDHELTYTIFWASMLFFSIPFIEQHIFKEKFADELLKTALASSRICFNEVDYLFSELDKEQKNALNKKEISQLLRIIQGKTTEEKISDIDLGYIVDRFFNLLDRDKNGSIEKDELKKYLSIHGYVINLNTTESE